MRIEIADEFSLFKIVNSGQCCPYENKAMQFATFTPTPLIVVSASIIVG